MDVREKLVEFLKQTEINKINGHTALAKTCFTPNVFGNMATNLNDVVVIAATVSVARMGKALSPIVNALSMDTTSVMSNALRVGATDGEKTTPLTEGAKTMAEAKEMDNLSRDMIQCKKDGFGCHYGAWKATQKPVVIQPRKDPFAGRYGVCRYCGETFIMDKKRERAYCDYECYNRHYIQLKSERLKGEKANGKAENVRDE